MGSAFSTAARGYQRTVEATTTALVSATWRQAWEPVVAMAERGAVTGPTDVDHVRAIWRRKTGAIADHIGGLFRVGALAGLTQAGAVPDGGPDVLAALDRARPPRRALTAAGDDEEAEDEAEDELPAWLSAEVATSWSLVNESAAAYAEAAQNRLVGIGDDAWATARAAIGEAIRSGATHEAMTSAIEDCLDVAENRASLIGRTEVTTASNAGVLDAGRALQAGPQCKQWSAVDDDRTREEHADADGTTVGIDETFDVDYAGQDAPDAPNCRCAVLLVDCDTGDEIDEESPVEPDAMNDDGGDQTDEEPTDDLSASGQRGDPMPRSRMRITAGRRARLVADAMPFTPTGGPRPQDQRPTPEQLVPPPSQEGEQWYSLMFVYGVATGESPYRMLADGSCTVRSLPIPLMFNDSPRPEHEGAVQVGQVTRIEITPEGSAWAFGTLDDLPDAGALVDEMLDQYGFLNVSIDLSVDFDAELLWPSTLPSGTPLPPDNDLPSTAAATDPPQPVDDAGDNEDAYYPPESVDDLNEEDFMDYLMMEPEGVIYTRSILDALTITNMPAMPEAFIALVPPEGLSAPPPAPTAPAAAPPPATVPAAPAAPTAPTAPAAPAPATVTAAALPPNREDVLVASAIPTAPPAWWFDNPAFGATPADDPRLVEITDEYGVGTGVYGCPLTIEADGRVFGHLALWSTCHTSFASECIRPPREHEFSYYTTGEVLTAEGSRVAVGHITMNTGHAGPDLRGMAAAEHYDHTGACVTDNAAGGDDHGIWVAGGLRPGVTPEQVRSLRASAISGDWRRIGPSLRLVAALAVNVPGFPIPRPLARVASGAPELLVAAGIITQERREMYRERLSNRLAIEGLAARAGRTKEARVARMRAKVHPEV